MQTRRAKLKINPHLKQRQKRVMPSNSEIPVLDLQRNVGLMFGQIESWWHQTPAACSPSEASEATVLSSKEREVNETTSARIRTGLTQIIHVVVYIHSIIKCFEHLFCSRHRQWSQRVSENVRSLLNGSWQQPGTWANTEDYYHNRADQNTLRLRDVFRFNHAAQLARSWASRESCSSLSITPCSVTLWAVQVPLWGPGRPQSLGMH